MKSRLISFFIFAAFLASLSTNNSHAMARKFVQNITQKESTYFENFKKKSSEYAKSLNTPYNKKLAAMTAAHGAFYALGFSTYQNAGVSDYYRDNSQIFTNVSPEVKKFCQEQGVHTDILAMPGFIPAHKIFPLPHASVCKNGFLFSEGQQKKLGALLAKQREIQQIEQIGTLTCEQLQLKNNINDQLDAWRFVIQHERGHIKHDDCWKSAFTGTAINIAAYILPLPMIHRFAHTSQFWKSGVYGMCISATGNGLNNQYAKRYEQRADDSVDNNVEILQAGKKFFEISYKIQKYDLSERFKRSIGSECPEQLLPWYYSLMHHTYISPRHPHPLTRAQNLQERITKLEVQEQWKRVAEYVKLLPFYKEQSGKKS